MDSVAVSRNKLLEGPILRSLLTLAIPIVTANAQGRQVVLLPALKAQSMRDGQTLLVTERGPEYVKPERLAQQMTLKPTAFAGICTPR